MIDHNEDNIMQTDIRRFFLAIIAPSAVRDWFRGWQQDMHNMPESVRFTDINHLHLTVIPPWDGIDPQAEILALEAAFQNGKLAAGRSLEVTLDHVGFGTKPGNPELFWLTGEPNVPWTTLANDISQIIGRPLTFNPPLPHITLGRFHRNDADEIIAALPPAFYDPVNLTFFATELALFETLRHPDQPTAYNIVQSWKL